MFVQIKCAQPNSWRVLALVALCLSVLTLGACKAYSAKTTSADEPAKTGETVEFTLEAYLSGYKGVGGSQPVAAHEGHGDSLMPGTAKALKKAKKVTTDEIGWNAADIPPPIERKKNTTVEYVIETE